MTLQARKYKLIQKITDSDNAELIIQLEQVINKKPDIGFKDDVLSKIEVSINDELDIDKLIKEQGFKHSTKEELDEIIKNANITEPIDELLDMI